MDSLPPRSDSTNFCESSNGNNCSGRDGFWIHEPASNETNETIPRNYSPLSQSVGQQTNAQYQCYNRTTGHDRERMKDLMANSFSRNETISILPGFKNELHKSSQKPCVKLINSCTASSLGNYEQHRHNQALHANSNGMCYPQQHNYEQEIQHQAKFNAMAEDEPMRTQSNGHFVKRRDGALNGAAGDSVHGWPYGQPKTQQDIRDAQAAYRRELDKQIEEKRMQKDKSERKCQKKIETTNCITATSTAEEPRSSGFSIDDFKNTGFLPPWFDPTKNNPLCTVTDHRQTTNGNPHSNTFGTTHNDCESERSLCDPPEDSGHQLGPGPSLTENSSVPHSILGQPMFPFYQHATSPLPTHMPEMIPSSFLPYVQANVQPHQNKFFVLTEEMLAQMKQNAQSPGFFLHGYPFNPGISGVQMILPNGQAVITGPGSVMYQHPSSDQFVDQRMSAPYQNDRVSHQVDNDLANVDETNVPPPPQFAPSPSNGVGQVDHSEEGHSEEASDGTRCSRTDETESDVHKSNLSCPHVSQTADQRPPEEVVRTYYKSQLAIQIEERRRSQLQKQTKEMEEEASLQRKIEEDQKKMALEYEEEQRQQKLKQEEYLKRQELILKEKERFEKEAEELRERKRLERRRQSLASPTGEGIENDQRISDATDYLSPIDLKVCAASACKSDDLSKEAQDQGQSEEESTSSQRPSTVILEVGGKSPKTQQVVDVNARSKSTSYLTPGPGKSRTKSCRRPRTGVREDLQFLANVRRALLAEDYRVEKSIKDKRNVDVLEF